MGTGVSAPWSEVVDDNTTEEVVSIVIDDETSFDEVELVGWTAMAEVTTN